MTISELIERVRRYDPALDAGWLTRVYELADAAHEGQRRASGESYIEHPLAVAGILAELEMDHQTIAAALLHDVVEDTSITSEQVTEKFGEEIARLVDGVTKLTRIPYQSKEDAQVENLRKMFLAMAKDIRVIIIKLADRLHNMRTLASLPPAKQQAIARETLDIYAPIAHRLGIWKIKWEIEDDAFAISTRFVSRHRRARREDAPRARSRCRDGHCDDCATSSKNSRSSRRFKAGQSTSTRSIPRSRSGRDFSTIYDLTGIRIIVDTRQGLLRGAGCGAFNVEAAAWALQRLHRDAQAQHVSVAAHDGASGPAATRSRFRYARGRCTAPASTASRHTGVIKKAARSISSRASCPGCARCSNGRRT